MKNKSWRIILSVFLMLSLSFSPALAANNTEKSNINKNVAPAEEQTIQSFSVSDKSPNKIVNQLKKSDEPDVSKVNLKSSHSIINMNTRAAEFNASGTLDRENSFAWVYPINLSNNQIVQAMMECPNNPNLDYDLYLFEYDPNTENITGNAIAYSTYKTYFNKYPDGTSKTLEEALGYVNTSGTTKQYALGVYSKVGSSTTDTFNLKISLDTPIYISEGKYDLPYDPKESQNAANPFMSLTPDQGIHNGKINCLADNDWFEITVPENYNANAEYIKWNIYQNDENITVQNNNCDTELYYTPDGQSMILIPETDKGYLFGTGSINRGGIYYLRVIPSDSFTSYTQYRFVPEITETTTKLVVTGYDSIAGPNNFQNIYLYGTRYWLPYNGEWITIKGYVGDLNLNKIDPSVDNSYEGKLVVAEWSSGGWANLPDDDPIFGNITSKPVLPLDDFTIKPDNTFEVKIMGIPPAEGVCVNQGSVYRTTFDIDTVVLQLNDIPAVRGRTEFYHGADSFKEVRKGK